MQAGKVHAHEMRRLRRIRWLTAALPAVLGLSALGAVMRALGG